MAYTLITGASGGIGYELARLFAKDGNDLILVARSMGKLESIKQELEKEYGVKVIPISKDLSLPDSSKEVYDLTKSMGISVENLVNNAGFGDCAAFLDADWNKLSNMVMLNVVALMQMSYLYGNDMRTNGKGRILNIASIAGFSSGPYMATYFATKNYVLAFSDALSEELKGSGVSVTVVCPGPTETNFESTSNLEKSNMFKVMKVAPVQSLAAYAYRSMMKQKVLAYYCFSNRMLNVLNRLAPRCIVRKIVKRINIPHE